MNKTRIMALVTGGTQLLFLSLAMSPGYSGEQAAGQHLVEGISNDATPAILDESGICMEARHFFTTETSMKIHIPISNRFGKAMLFHMEVSQGPGRRMTTETYLRESDGTWAPTIYASFWSLSHPSSYVFMFVRYEDEKTGNATHIRFHNLDLMKLLAMEETGEDSDKIYRAGCGRWDSENAAREATPR